MPESSDKTGGFLRLRYIRGASGWLGSDRDIKALTTERPNFLVTYDRFWIAGGAISLVPGADSCEATFQIEYEAFSRTGFKQGQFVLQSNNKLESTILDELETSAPASSEPGRAPVSPPAAPSNTQPAPPATTIPSPTAAVAFAASAPTPPSSGAGLVYVTLASNPPGALVSFSGMEIARTPASTKLPPGRYVATMKLAGYAEWKKEFWVEEGKPVTIVADMAATQ